MDLALNDLQKLICHKPKQPTNQPFKNSENQSTVNKVLLSLSNDNCDIYMLTYQGWI